MDHKDLLGRINNTEADPRPPMKRIPYEWRDYAKVNEQNRCVEASVKVATIKRIFFKLFGGKKKWKQS